MTEPAASDAPKKAAAPKKPEESPAQRAARTRRDKLAHVVRALMDEQPPHNLPSYGAALFTAHLEVELGMDALSRMSAADVREKGEAFRHRYPQLWGACHGANVVKFAGLIRAAGLREDADSVEAVRDEYQFVVGQLLGS